MSKESNDKRHKKKVYAAIIALVAVVSLVSSSLGMLVAYPTQAHRDVIRQFNDINEKAGQGDTKAIIESQEYKRLQDSPEMRYSMMIGFVLMIVELLITFTVVGTIYHYLRRNRLGGSAAGVAAWLYVFGGFITTLIMAYVDSMYVMKRAPQPVELLVTVLATFTIGLAIAYLIARFFKWNYDRRHSFVVE